MRKSPESAPMAILIFGSEAVCDLTWPSIQPFCPGPPLQMDLYCLLTRPHPDTGVGERHPGLVPGRRSSEKKIKMSPKREGKRKRKDLSGKRREIGGKWSRRKKNKGGFCVVGFVPGGRSTDEK